MGKSDTVGKDAYEQMDKERRHVAVSLDGQADEERRGLLSGVEIDVDDSESVPDAPRSWWSRRGIAAVAISFSILLLAGLFIRPLVLNSDHNGPASHPMIDASATQSNGTHDFKRTVLLVSIDGLRADYLERGFTPHLLAISKKGLRAKYMQSIFPTLTFPNHWALMTGLYAESHGIVANDFWDPVTEKEFTVSDFYNSSWWLGEPMWETAGKTGMITANLMWPGPPETTSGASPTYFVPWRDHVPLSEKHDQIMTWIDLPVEERPQLIMAYEPSLDQAGHLTGPHSSLVNETLIYIDDFAKSIHDSLAARNLTEIVDVVFVSDHGMTDTSNPEWVYVDDILGEEGYALVEHEDGWPSMGLRFAPDCNVSHYLNILVEAGESNSEKFDVFTRETMPERYHFSNSERIAPIYIVPKMGYALTNKREAASGMSKGNHGYDNGEPAMHAIFVAHGPFPAVAKSVHQSRSKRLFSRLLDNPNRGWHSTDDNVYVMDGFENVEIYSLIMKLLGIQQWSANTNGSVEFWDKFF